MGVDLELLPPLDTSTQSQAIKSPPVTHLMNCMTTVWFLVLISSLEALFSPCCTVNSMTGWDSLLSYLPFYYQYLEIVPGHKVGAWYLFVELMNNSSISFCLDLPVPPLLSLFMFSFLIVVWLSFICGYSSRWHQWFFSDIHPFKVGWVEGNTSHEQRRQKWDVTSILDDKKDPGFHGGDILCLLPVREVNSFV
jgi:hypothetical protein